MQKFLVNNVVKLLVITLGISGLLAIEGCSRSSSNSTTAVKSQTALTIDNAGTIPVFGNSSTSTVVYVHNNTNESISDISYSLTSNVAHTPLASKLTSTVIH